MGIAVGLLWLRKSHLRLRKLVTTVGNWLSGSDRIPGAAGMSLAAIEMLGLSLSYGQEVATEFLELLGLRGRGGGGEGRLVGGSNILKEQNEQHSELVVCWSSLVGITFGLLWLRKSHLRLKKVSHDRGKLGEW